MRAWHYAKREEIRMLRSKIDEKWIGRIKELNLQNNRAGFVFKRLWDEHPLDRDYIGKEGYSVEIKMLNVCYVGQLLKRIKGGKI